ncbi:Transcription factor basic helix-loop-helix 111, partial [Cucurbita argyrosperma subsp. sororia]
MADDCTDTSVATSSTPPNWWDTHNHHHHHYNSNSCDDDVSISTSSFTNASNHSALTLDSSSAAAAAAHLLPHHASDHHLWTQVLLNIGNGVEDIQPNFLEPIACSDYLKKMDTNTNWDDTFQTFNNNNGLLTTLENERLLKLSNLVNTWSIALPSPDAHLRHLIDQEPHPLRPTTLLDPDAALDPCASAFFRRSLHNPMPAKPFYDNHTATTRNYGDYISFNPRFAKPLLGVNPSIKSLNLSAQSKKQIQQISSPTRGSGRGSGVLNEGKKKRSEESSETVTKKAKQDNSTTPASTKIQQPKVKIGDRITTLQQIVSPFGKTDTASVLNETIGYIKFLQEQVQLLTNPYMKANSYKDAWQSLERKESKGEGKMELRSRGLCLVPISCTPQVYRENSGSDYWTPYRGCFYR